MFRHPALSFKNQRSIYASDLPKSPSVGLYFLAMNVVKKNLTLDSRHRISQVDINRRTSLKAGNMWGKPRGETDRLPQDGGLILGRHGG